MPEAFMPAQVAAALVELDSRERARGPMFGTVPRYDVVLAARVRELETQPSPVLAQDNEPTWSPTHTRFDGELVMKLDEVELRVGISDMEYATRCALFSDQAGELVVRPITEFTAYYAPIDAEAA